MSVILNMTMSCALQQTAQSARLAGSPPTGTLASDGVQAAQCGNDSDAGAAPSDLSQV